ncbi:hypothetical protein [Kurthia massiliensis]|uniref:hypothetical protein n=1 Tax=Kurthia massiliensis TaxID=1033739 RepID=UPI0002888F9C|nr:hypothetical protein [Kurthia massiliensis]
MKSKVIVGLLILSVVGNLCLLGKWYWFEKPYIPDEEDRVVLSEMVKKTIDSPAYQKIAKKEDVIAIEPWLDKNKGGAFPYYYEVSVRTDRQTYIFSCADEACEKMENGSWTYSIYADEKPHLPFK